MTEPGSELSITVALAYLVTWYTPEWWSASSHAYDHVAHGGVPYSKLPKTVVKASLDDTLAVVLDRAGKALDIAPGPDAMKYTSGATNLSSMLPHIGFYRPADEDGFNVQESYRWRNRLPVADVAGNVSYHPCQEVTYRQLMVSADLGLINGDVMRPYICPSMPQGDIPTVTEVARVAVDAARAAYSALDAGREHIDDVQRVAREHIDDAQRAAFVWTMWHMLKQRFRRKKNKSSAPPARGRRRWKRGRS